VELLLAADVGSFTGKETLSDLEEDAWLRVLANEIVDGMNLDENQGESGIVGTAIAIAANY
jgi:hypothetical protein